MKARFIYEQNIRDILKPKSEEEIEKSVIKEIDYILSSVPKQDKNDDSMFRIDFIVSAMGGEFDPDSFDMTLKEMLNFIDEGIEYFKNFNKYFITYNDTGKFSDFFIGEFDDNEEPYISKSYAIGKMICGKENAKWNANES
jgi:hypothetical protein